MQQKNTQETSDFFNEIIEDFNIKLLGYVLKKSILWIILLGCFIGVFTYLYLRYSTDIYQSDASLLLKKSPETLKVLNADQLLQQDDAEINREIQLIKSNLVLKRTIEKLPLSISYYKLGRTRFVKSELYRSAPFKVENLYLTNPSLYGKELFITFYPKKKFTLKYTTNGSEVLFDGTINTFFKTNDISFNLKIDSCLKEEDILGEYFIIPHSQEELISQMASKIEVLPLNAQTQSIQIRIKGPTPSKDIEIIDTLISTFIDYDIERKGESVDNILQFIAVQLDTFSADAKEYRDTIRTYKKKHNLYAPEDQLRELLDKSKTLEQKLVDIRTQERLFYDMIQDKSYKKDEYYISPFSTSNNISEDFIQSIKSLNDLKKTRENLLLDLKPEHPAVQIIENKILNTTKGIDHQLKTQALNLELELKQLNERYNQVKGQLFEIPEKTETLETLGKQNETRQNFLLELYNKKAQFLVAKAGIVSDYIILQPAQTNPFPISPKRKNIQGTAFALFILGGLLLVLSRYFGHRFITTVNEVKKRVTAPVLGVIPKHQDETMTRSKVVVTSNPKSRISEAFRGIRANIQFLGGKNDSSKVIATTSTIPGEGKTFVNINLAAIHSILDKKVVLLDLDMRKPRISKIFGTTQIEGMSSLLSGQCSLEEAIQSSSFKNLDLITSGPIPPNPSELIMSEKFRTVLDELRKKYDYIFLDTPPVGLVTDALELLSLADIPLYVVRADYSKKDFLFNIQKIITENNLKNLSVVINDFGRGASGDIYEYGYGYGYGYGYSYSQAEGYYTDSEKASQVKRNFWYYLKNWRL